MGVKTTCGEEWGVPATTSENSLAWAVTRDRHSRLLRGTPSGQWCLRPPDGSGPLGGCAFSSKAGVHSRFDVRRADALARSHRPTLHTTGARSRQSPL